MKLDPSVFCLISWHDLLSVAFCDDSTSHAWSFLSADPPCRNCFFDDVVVDCRRIYFIVDVVQFHLVWLVFLPVYSCVSS